MHVVHLGSQEHLLILEFETLERLRLPTQELELVELGGNHEPLVDFELVEGFGEEQGGHHMLYCLDGALLGCDLGRSQERVGSCVLPEVDDIFDGFLEFQSEPPLPDLEPIITEPDFVRVVVHV